MEKKTATTTRFDLLREGSKFRSIGKITGLPSQYLYEKVPTKRDDRGISYNALAFRGEHREKTQFFYGDDRVQEEV